VERVTLFFSINDRHTKSAESNAEKMPPRLSNRLFEIAKDNAIRSGAGLNMKHFQHYETDWALRPDEVRFFTRNTMQGDDEPKLRACIHNTRTGATRYEVNRSRLPDGRDYRPALHQAQDEGAIGFPAALFELYRANVRGSLSEDEWHRICNDLADACREAECWTTIVSWGVVTTFKSSPWKGSSFLRVIGAVMTAYFRDQDETEATFVCLYPMIAKRLGVHKDLDFASRDHMRRVFLMCKEHKVWQNVGTKMKMGRWTSWFLCQEEIRPGTGILLLALVQVGLKQGWWPSLARCPLFFRGILALEGLDEEPEVIADDLEVIRRDPTSEEPVRQTVAASNRDIANAKKKCHNLMNFAALTLANEFGGRLVDVLVASTKVIRHDFWSGISACYTQAGAHERDLWLQRGGYTEVLAETLALWSKIEVLDNLDFLNAEDRDVYDLDESMALERRLLAHWFALMLRVSDSRLGSTNTWTHAYPHHFVGLISANQEQRRNTMDDCRAAFMLLERLEVLARADNFVRQFLQDLLWPLDAFTRETFIDLVEHDFQLPLPSPLHRRISRFARAKKRTKICEDAFKVARKRQSLVETGIASRRSTWDTLVSSTLIQSYDAKNLVITQEAKSCAPKLLDKSYFECTAGSMYSMGEAVLDEMKQEPTPYPSPSPASYKLRGDAWQCAIQMNGDPRLLRMSWISLLAMPGYLLYHRVELAGGASDPV
jgi:hypothetical protein